MPAPVKTVADFFVPLAPFSSNSIEPQIVASENGGFEIFYSADYGSNTDAYTQRFDALMNGVGLQFLTENLNSIDTRETDSTFLSNGFQVRVWTEEPVPSGGDQEDIYADILFPDGTEFVADFLVTGGADNQIKPAVAASVNGTFAVAHENYDVGGTGIIIKIFNNLGNLVNTVNINDGLFGNLNESFDSVSITSLSNGNYVVAYTDGAFDGLFAIYSSTGGQILAPGFIVPAGGGISGFPDVIELADGNFLITYYGDGNAEGSIFKPDGTIVNSDFEVGTGIAQSFGQAVVSAALDDGRFITIWVTVAGEIQGQMFLADGTKDGSSFMVNSTTTGTQQRPTIDILADGRIVIAWETDEGVPNQLKATVFDPRTEGQNIAGTNDDDSYVGSDFDDTIITKNGDDTVDGGGGKDRIFGEGGDDILAGGAGDDDIEGGAGNDIIGGNNGVDVLDGGFGDDTINGGNKNDVVLGGGGEDILNGNKGNDTLNGGNDDDELNGGAGADTLNGQDGDDDLNGGGQADVLNGGSGVDDLDGGSGNDILSGGSGGDELDGGNGSDQLFGNSGADTLRGGEGNDILTGGSDAGDTFFYQDVDDGADTILDFQDGLDMLVFSGLIQPGNIQVTSVGGGDDTLITVNGFNITIRLENVDSTDITIVDDMAFI